jgi:hypothetical protein
MLSLIIIAIFMLIGISLTYVAIYIIKPEKFRMSASLRWISFALDIKMPSKRDGKARKDGTGSESGPVTL